MYKANNVVNLATKATKIRGKSHRSKNLNYSQWKKNKDASSHTAAQYQKLHLQIGKYQKVIEDILTCQSLKGLLINAGGNRYVLAS